MNGCLTVGHLYLSSDPAGHAIAMGVFGFAGYLAHKWDERAAVLLEAKRADIAERRARLLSSQP